MLGRFIFLIYGKQSIEFKVLEKGIQVFCDVILLHSNRFRKLQESKLSMVNPAWLIAWRMTHDAWHMTHDAWCMMHDAWCMIHDTWYMIHDTWYMICAIGTVAFSAVVLCNSSSIYSICVIGMRVLADSRLKVSRTYKSAAGRDRWGSKPDGLSSLGQRSLEEVDHNGKMMVQQCRNVDAKK